ncbi:hypothetical protein MASR2M15_24060 [Anaerolineales bacterium]
MKRVLLIQGSHPEARKLFRQALRKQTTFAGSDLFDSMTIRLRGKYVVSVGRLQNWIPFEGIIHFELPYRVYWEYHTRQINMRSLHAINAYDGKIFRSIHNGWIHEENDQAQKLENIRKKIWALSALLLSTLNEHYYSLAYVDKHTLLINHLIYGDYLRLSLRDDQSLFSSSITLSRAEEEEIFTVCASKESIHFPQVILPKTIETYWGKSPTMLLEPYAVHMNPTFDPALFRLEAYHPIYRAQA